MTLIKRAIIEATAGDLKRVMRERREFEGPGEESMTDAAIVSDEKLLERAVRGARPRKGRVPKWSAVADVFALGSTYSIQLCRRFGIDPDQQVGRNGVVR